MRPLVINLSVVCPREEPRNEELPLTPELASYLQAAGLLEHTLSFLSVPRSPVSDPRLRVETADTSGLIEALLQRRREVPSMGPAAGNDPLKDRALLIEYGDARMVASYDDGVLSDADFNAVARRVFFAPFESCPRWSMIRIDEMRHTASCLPPRGGYGKVVSFSVRPNTGLDGEGQSAFWQIGHLVSRLHHTEIAGEAPVARVVKRDHIGTCTLCKRETVEPSCHISIFWNGRLFVREYAL